MTSWWTGWKTDWRKSWGKQMKDIVYWRTGSRPGGLFERRGCGIENFTGDFAGTQACKRFGRLTSRIEK